MTTEPDNPLFADIEDDPFAPAPAAPPVAAPETSFRNEFREEAMTAFAIGDQPLITIPGKLTAIGLELPEGLPQEDWLYLTKALFKVQKGMQWAIGDALVYGSRNYPDPEFIDGATSRGGPIVYARGKPVAGGPISNDRYSYQAVAEMTGYPVGQLYDIASVCRQIPTSLRNEVLTFSHHRAVRALPGDRQTYWLNTAAELGFSVLRLRYEISVHEKDGLKILTGGTLPVEEHLLPPALQRPVDPESEKPAASALATKNAKQSKGLQTHLTIFEIHALEDFVAEKKINTNVAIRALVTMGLHASGHLQKVTELSEADLDAERAYLGYLGENWFGDPEKFKIERLSEEPLVSDIPENKHPNRQPTFNHSEVSSMERYTKLCADFLTLHPELTVEDVQANLGDVSIKYAAHILAEARKIVAAEVDNQPDPAAQSESESVPESASAEGIEDTTIQEAAHFKSSNISWTDGTWNPWRGCDKVGPECENCYIDRFLRREGKEPWGQVYRAKTTWNEPLKVQKRAGEFIAQHGHRYRFFTCSLSDFFHRKADQWRPEAWEIIRKCPDVDFLILTKRANRIVECLPADWGQGYPNVWLGVSIGMMKTAWRADRLRQIPATIRFISAEPLLESLADLNLDGIHWLIAGGESGSNHRPMDPEWVLELREQCRATGTTFFFKQISAPSPGKGEDALGKIYHDWPIAVQPVRA